MKHLIRKSYICLLLLLLAASAFAQVHVRGYYRSNGTYVQPHERTSPNHTITDNYSYPGNYNPNTGKITGGDSNWKPPSSTYNSSYNSSSSKSTESYNSSTGTYAVSSPYTRVTISPAPKPGPIRYAFVEAIPKPLLSEAVLRETALVESAEIMRIPKAAIVNLTEKDAEFYRTIYKGKQGYIHFLYIDGDYQTFATRNYPNRDAGGSDEINRKPIRTDLYGKVTIESPLKIEPDYRSKTVYDIPAGTVLGLSRYSDLYWRTQINNIQGYISSTYIATTGESVDEVNGVAKLPVKSRSVKYNFLRKSHSYYPPVRVSSQYYIRGPRGGCYYLTASGRKQYVDRSLCD